MSRPARDRALLLLALLLGTLFPASAWGQTLTLWHSYRGSEQEDLQAALARYEALHPGLTIQAQAVPHDNYANKLSAAIPRGNGPDLFIFAHERAGEWTRSGLIAPLELRPEEQRDLLASCLDAVHFDGAQRGLPLSFKSPVLFYNRSLVPTPPATTDALLSALRRLRDPQRQAYGLVYEAGNFYFHAGWLFGFGGSVFDEEGRPRLDDPGNVASFAFARDLLVDDLIPDEATGTLVTQLFNDGQAAMVINGPWFEGEIRPGLDWGVAPLPTVSSTGEPARPFLTVDAVYLNAYGTQPEPARDLAGWLAADAESARLRVSSAAVAHAPTYRDPEVAADPTLAVYSAQAEAAVPMPNRPEMGTVWEPANEALRKTLRGSAEPTDALALGQRRLAILLRPPPEAASPAPFLALLGAILLGLGWWALQGAKKAGGWSAIKRERSAYAYLAPASLAMVLLVFAPFIVGSAVSLFAHRDGQFTFVGLRNFGAILFSSDYPVTDPLSFYFTLAVTLLWTAANVFLHVSIGVLLALLLNSRWVRLKAMWRVLLILPWAIPNYITALIWKGMFHRQFGAINELLGWFGIEPVSWFSRFWTAFTANLVTNTWLGFPFMMVVTLGALQSIPSDVMEAAEIDGASPVTRFFRITLPLLRPALLPAVILGSVWTFNMFNIIYLVSAGQPDGATEILISEAYRWAFTRQAQYGYAAAYAVIIFVVLLGYSALTNRLKAEPA